MEQQWAQASGSADAPGATDARGPFQQLTETAPDLPPAHGHPCHLGAQPGPRGPSGAAPHGQTPQGHPKNRGLGSEGDPRGPSLGLRTSQASQALLTRWGVPSWASSPVSPALCPCRRPCTGRSSWWAHLRLCLPRGAPMHLPGASGGPAACGFRATPSIHPERPSTANVTVGLPLPRGLLAGEPDTVQLSVIQPIKGSLP